VPDRSRCHRASDLAARAGIGTPKRHVRPGPGRGIDSAINRTEEKTMDSLVAVVAVAAWLLVMVPAAFVLFLGGGADTEERPTGATLALVPPAANDERDERVAA
jgi:hypothetical protein